LPYKYNYLGASPDRTLPSDLSSENCQGGRGWGGKRLVASFKNADLYDICNLDGISYFITIIQDITKGILPILFTAFWKYLQIDSFNMTPGLIFKGLDKITVLVVVYRLLGQAKNLKMCRESLQYLKEF